MRSWAGMLSILVVAAILLAGCTGVKKTLPANETAPTLFIDYQRSGGIAGLNDRLIIFDNGAGIVQTRTTNREIRLSQSDLEQISALFNTSRFHELEGNYTSARGGADLMQFSISYRGRTVNTEDTAIPPALEPVIEELDRIVSSAGARSGQTDIIPAGMPL